MINSNSIVLFAILAIGTIATSYGITPNSTYAQVSPIQHGVPTAISVNPTTNMVYVANSIYMQYTNVAPANGTVSVIDGKTNGVTDNITVGRHPAVTLATATAISANPTTNMIYVVTIRYNHSYNGTVSVIDGKTNSITTTIKVPAVALSTAISVNPTTNMVYVANEGTVSVIDGKTNTIRNNITVGAEPTAISVNPTTNMVYVASSRYNHNGTVSVIDGKTNTIRNNITVGAEPTAMSVNPTSNMVYVANEGNINGNGTVSVIDGKTNSVTDNITQYTVGSHPTAISVNPTSNVVYIASYNKIYWLWYTGPI